MTCCTNEHAGWFRDVRAILKAVQAARPGLPLPQISATAAVFSYMNVPHAEDAADLVAMARTILSYALHLEFSPRDVPRIGTSEHCILSAYMLSGLRVDIVAKAGHFGGQDAREDARKLVAA